MWNPEAAPTPAVLISALQGVLKWGRAERLILGEVFAEGKKRGVPRLHEKMLPGNSFPQICVVSGNTM
jgi:hypothetical protein